MKKRRCYIYTRVSTSMQVEGYSLEAQKERLRKYADFQEMVIVGEYSDEGKSGKSIEGRQEFMQMLRDIEEGKDRVEFVLVYKLSRFGRNAADVLNSLQRMQDFGVNLICVEDGIDSSKDSGKLMISVLSAVAEIERENILVQTMEGRRQKARDGKWNGGFAPYGYKLLNGELEIAEDEAEIIRIIFDKYIHTNMGVNGIAAYLNEHGYKKKKRQNNTLDAFATSFIKGVLDNPIYCGKLAFGRRKTERVPGKRNEFRIVKQDSYILSDGIHEAIISEDDWNLAKQKRNINGVKHEKIHSLEHEHILSGILKCPICGKGMYGNVNRKKKKDGTFYKDYFYYYEILLNEGKTKEEALEILAARSRDNSRTPMQWTDERYCGFSDTKPWIPVSDNFEKINVKKQKQDRDSILEFYKKLIMLRKEKEVIARGNIEFMEVENAGVLAYTRCLDKQKLLVCCNFRDVESQMEFTQEWKSGRKILGNYEENHKNNYKVLTLRPYEIIVLEKGEE